VEWVVGQMLVVHLVDRKVVQRVLRVVPKAQLVMTVLRVLMV
jgi:hypothetical protein